MSQIQSIINRANIINENIKSKMNSSATFEEGFKVDKVFINSATVNYELERITFIVELKDEDDIVLPISNTIVNTYGKITIDTTAYDLFESAEELHKYLEVFRSIDFSELENIINGYKTEREVLFDLLCENAKFKERRRISKVICSPLFNDTNYYPSLLYDNQFALSIKIVSMDKEDPYDNTLNILLDIDGIIKAGTRLEDSTYENAFDDFENPDDVKKLLVDFFVYGIVNNRLIKELEDNLEEMKRPLDNIPKETIFDKIRAIFNKIFK